MKSKLPRAILQLSNHELPNGRKTVRWELLDTENGTLIDHANSEMEIYDRNRSRYVIEKLSDSSQENR